MVLKKCKTVCYLNIYVTAGCDKPFLCVCTITDLCIDEVLVNCASQLLYNCL